MSIIRPFGMCVAVLGLFVSDVSARPAAENPPAWVSTESIQVASSLQPEIEDMLRWSATFRLQYRRIAESPSIRVGVHVDARLCESNFRARTTFRRYVSGLIVVEVAIGPGAHQSEWIAHEFEHILEQLDGRNLPQLANDRARDVWYSGVDTIETGRAIRAGRTVRDEMQQPRISR